MDKKALILLLASVLASTLCLDPGAEKSEEAEKHFNDAVAGHGNSRSELKAAIDSGNYADILLMIGKYNYSVRNLDARLAGLCADPDLREKYSEICLKQELLERCNARDVEGTALIMKVIHDPGVSRQDCGRLTDIIIEQEECRVLAQAYVPAQGDRDEAQEMCDSLG